MVQYKRKPVKLEPLPSFLDDSTEIWVIEATGEIFVDYERYLNRRDFYLQNIFTCESTGHQGYNFFEAIESETEASNEINSIFPDTLRSRVLEFIQFRNTARMDDLVNNVFDHFREHYTVGDRVYIEHENGRKYGVISQMQDTSGLHSVFTGEAAEDHEIRSFTYYITLDEGGEPVTRYKASELQRDRRIYSKLVLKQFLRSAVTREPWNGAPWMVKDHLAKRYSIPTRIPEAKTRDAVMAAKKASIVNIESEELPANPPGMPSGPNGAAPLPANGVAVHGPPHMGPPPAQTGPGWMNFAANGQPYHHNPGRPMMQPPRNEPPRPYPVPYPHQMSAPPPFPPGPYNHPPPTVPLPQQLAHMPHHMPPPGAGLPVNLPFQNNFMQYQALAPINALQHQVPTLTRPFEPIKYPIDDLRIKQPRLSTHRPSLKFFSDDVPEGVEVPEDQKKMGILMKSVGPLLCAWETLNVHDTIYSLDSFTFDDFVGAMRFSQEGVECELLIEVHCSVLKQIINESGKFQVTLPSPADSDGSGDEASDKSTSPKPEPEPPVRTTRSSLRKSEASIIVKQRTPTPEPPKQIHKGGEFTVDFNWIDQCKTRNFRDGGWQAIIVGLLYRLSCDPGQKEACDEILAQLVPADEEPSIENIAFNYISLDVNLRISALDMILRLTIATETFRDQLVAASQEMTRLRKEKIEFQKKRKELADELFKLDIDRKIQLPMNTPASPTDAKENQDVLMGGVEDGRKATEAASESSEEPTAANRKLRHTNKAKRKRELDAVKKEKAKKAKVEAAKTKQQKDWEKLLDAIDKKREELKTCEASINELDDDLRETLVHRSKILGKDRFLNKYYWFEHNGMPFGGVPNSSTAEYGYANGRLWVQGPDELELQPNLEEPALSQDKQEFGFTIPMRKEKEEGSTHLATSGEWGYYDDPADVDRLMAWLDERGFREKALRKELQIFRERIVEYMVKMKEHLVEAELEKEEEEEVSTRVATRKKTYVDTDPGQDRCLLWTNSIMRNEFGYNHSEEYEPPKKPKKGTAKVTKAKGKR